MRSINIPRTSGWQQARCFLLAMLLLGGLATAQEGDQPDAQEPPEQEQAEAPPETPPEEAASEEAATEETAAEEAAPEAATPAAIEDLPEPVDVPEGEGLAINGSFYLEWRHRHAESGQHDSDLLGVLGVTIGDPNSDDVSAHFLGRSRWDLDGQEAINPFNGIEETYDGDLTGWIYDAYVDFHSIPGLSLARIGRQTLYDTPEVLFLDGVRADSEEMGDLKIKVGGYFGIPTRLWDVYDDGEMLGGALFSLRPWQGSRFRFDWTHVKDLRNNAEFKNDLFSIAGWQAFNQYGRAHARVNWLEDEVRDYYLRADGFISAWDLQTQVSYRELLNTQLRLATEFDPYSSSAFAQDPYRQFNIQASKSFWDSFLATGGFDFRRLVDTGDEGQFNRDYERYYLNLSYYTLEPLDMSLGLTGDWWDSSGEDVFAAGLDWTVRFIKNLETAIGTNYSAFRYDPISQRERVDVRTIYLRLDWRIDPALRWRINYGWEDDELDNYHVLRTGITWEF